MKRMKKLLLTIPVMLALAMPACAAQADIAGAEGAAAFFPLMPDTMIIYTVEGMESPGTRMIYNTYISGNRAQRMVTASHFPPSLEIIEAGEEQVRLIFGDPFHYNIENLTHVAPSIDFIILQGPIEVGTSWSNGPEISQITAVDAQVETPVGTFTAIQVTTTTPGGFEERYYYAEGVGLVKSVHPNELGTFVVTMYEILRGPATLPLFVLFPNIVENTIEVEPRPLSVLTNTDIVPLLAHELSTPPPAAAPLLPYAAALNSIEIHRAENLAHVDLSSSFRDWQDFGDGTMSTVFMALTNTIGLFAEVTHVSYSIDGAPFEWGQIQLAVGEAVRVQDFSEIE
ncbi:MAG: GerMN domain-containing protein [Defluviitaleaceae bacterium]|nr:GerMN domain-containing protein [Defluviitaleaceae bacterium]